MRGVNIPGIRSIMDLHNTNEIYRICHSKKEPICITKNGYGDMVIMSIETYEQLLASVEMDSTIRLAKEKIANGGELVEARGALGALRGNILDKYSVLLMPQVV